MDSNAGMAKQKLCNEEHAENERELHLQQLAASSSRHRGCSPPESIDGQELPAGWGRHRGRSPPKEIDGQALAHRWADCKEADRKRKGKDTTSTEPAQPLQNAHVDFFANSESSDDEPTPAELKVLMSTDVEHKQVRYVACEGVTPAAFQRKGNRHVSLPPPSRGRSNQCTSLYFGGDASHWWWPEWYLVVMPPPNRVQDH